MRLYQFAGSHYCEKARWALDFKGIDYAVTNLVPGPHRRAVRRIAPRTSLPVLVAGDTYVQGSAAIIDYLDKIQRQPPLTPTNSTDASMAVEWERYLDRHLAPQVRLLFYHHAFQDRAYVTDFLLRGGPWWGRPFFALAFPVLKRAMQESMSIDPSSAARAEQQIAQAFERLDERVVDKKYLAGPHFSRADLAASATLFHWWMDEWRWPPSLHGFVDAHRDRPFFRWAENIYRAHRGPRPATS